MADYMVRFKIHLVSMTKPEGWDSVLFHDIFVRAENFQMLKQLTNNEAGTFIQQQGVVVMRREKKPLGDDSDTLDLRVFIPMHMIAYIDAETKTMTGQMPDMMGDGREGDGEGVKLQ